MAEIHLPLSITYETEGATPVADIVEALQATDVLARDAVSLLPSLIDGVEINDASLNVVSLSQQSPLREVFFIAMVATYQKDLERQVPGMIEDLFGITVSDKYDTIASVVFLVVAFYGASLAIDAAKRIAAESGPRHKYQELVELLSRETGKSPQRIYEILNAKFQKPSSVRKLISRSKRVFLPSQRDNNAPLSVDRERIGSDLIREIPYPKGAEKDSDFDRYSPHTDINLELHAMDRDKSSTGWAAVAPEISERRMKARVVDPVQPSDLWGKTEVVADVVVVSKLTAEGYVPSEIQITAVHA